jgi:hypothetical protein
MECRDERAAKEVVRLCNEAPHAHPGGNEVNREGNIITITYSDKMWPYDIAEMASDLKLVGDSQAAAVFQCL